MRVCITHVRGHFLRTSARYPAVLRNHYTYTSESLPRAVDVLLYIDH